MRRLLFILAVAAASLTSCDITIDTHEQMQAKDSTAVGFNVYVNRGVMSKAGYQGDLTTATLTNVAGGFGVFAYYGDGVLYNETSKPDFMYNQQVTYNSTYRVWEYKPLKYWPNEYGDAAGSQSADRLTFFAYAPYVPVTPSTGIVTATGDDAETGILGMSRNISPGDPKVMYGSTFTPGTGVDLCWGVALEDFFSSVDGNNNHVNKGEPFIDVVKPKTGDHLKFEFNHALTQLNITVDAAIDVETAGANDTLAAGSKIYVRSVTFTGLTTRGSLNLNSKAGKPAWFDIAGTGRLSRDPVTVYDGRSDGQEGVSTASDVTEFPQGLNPNIIQKGVPTSGVTNETVNLFANENAEAPIMVIPVAGVPMEVTIVYDIETADDHLAGFLSDGATHGVSVENRITKRIKTDEGDLVLDPGKKYTINLHLGLTSVKFEAEARDWDNSLEYNGTAYLPENASSLGTVTITTDGTTPLTSLTTWKGETMASAPQVSVVDDQGQPVTEFDKEWTSSDTGVATVAADGKVTAVAPGIATITVKVTKGDKSSSKSFTVYINEVTGIVSVEPASQNVVKGGTANLTATLTLNGGQQVNGTITTDPGLTWSSDPGITVASNGWSVDGSTLTVTATASAASTAAEGDHTVTASIGTLNASATLTCVDKISIASVNLGATSTTVWISQGASTPTVTVMGTNSQALTSGITKTWASDNESVATVTDAGVVTLHGTGTAKLTITAHLAASATTEESSKTADYMVYVNNVTGVTVAPATSNIVKDGTLDLTATLEINGGSDINGTVAAWPTVTWTSGYNKVSLNPTSTDASNTGTAVEASTTASAAADAVTDTQATITAAIGSPYAESDVSGTATLTCKDKISIDHIDLSAPSTTVWLLQGASTPTVTVVGTDGNPLTTDVTLAWTSNNTSVATVTDAGVITLQGTGTATLTVTATLAASATTAADTETADFTVNVNAVTGITLTPATSNILIGSTLEVKATLTLNNGNAVNGTITAWPTVAWTSDYAKVTVISPSTAAQTTSGIEATTTATAATDATAGTSATITATVAATFTASSTSSVSQTCKLTCSNLTGSGNGYSGGWDEL